jgi:NAD(P)-dependent dehydrogenase (short-subunit alcohol dehydrogenase family)
LYFHLSGIFIYSLFYKKNLLEAILYFIFPETRIRVNGVLPGAIKTPGTESHIKNAILKLQFNLIKTSIDFKARLTAGRWGNPDEVALVVIFLSSDLSSYVHGVMLPVDGGFLAS